MNEEKSARRKKGLSGLNSMEGRMKDTQRGEKGRTRDGKEVITMREGQRGEVEIKGTMKKLSKGNKTET